MTKLNNNKVTVSRFKLIVAFSAIYLIWGSTFLTIRFALESLPPFIMAGLRFTIAGTIFYIWCLLRCDKKPDLEHWKKTIITGILMISIGHGCLAWSEQFIPSGMAALVVATIPIWMILQDWLFDTKKSPDLLTVIGIVVGFSGVVLLYLFQSNFMARVFQLNLFSTR